MFKRRHQLPPTLISESFQLNFKRLERIDKSQYPSRRLLRFALLIGMLLVAFCFPSLSHAAQVTLAWDANNPTPDGYRLYQRARSAAYDYSRPVWSGSGTTCTINNLNEETQYHFVVRAYVGNLESGDSNEVSFSAPPTSPTPANNAPAADAGSDQTVAGGTIVMLDGRRSSDPDQDTLSYAWTQTGGPSVTLSGRTTAQPTFTAPAGASANTILTFQLRVTDPDGLSASDTCRVTIMALVDTNDPPVAEAGNNQTVVSGASVTLDGSRSTDPEGQALSYRWVQTSGPSVQLASASRARASFTAPTVSAGQRATLLFELTVTDSQTLTCTDTCIVQVNPAPIPDSGGGTPGGDTSTPDEDPSGNDPSSGEENQAPDRPAILSPAEGATGVSLRTRISASSFSDPDSGDKHKKSQWRIFNAADQRTVMDLTQYRSLTSIRLPYFLLDPGRTYICQVRYYDQDGSGSEWSAPVSFTTTGRTYWWNSRGIVEGQEVANDTDLNANGVADPDEAQHIKSMLAADGQHTMAVSIEERTDTATIDGAGAIDPYAEETPPQADDMEPYGLVAYRVQLAQPGDSTAVSLYFSAEVDPQATWVSMSSDGDYADCSAQVVERDDGSFTRELTDGGEGDLDGVANGVIIDAVGPRSLSSTDQSLDSGSTSSGGGGGGGCFIRSLLR